METTEKKNVITSKKLMDEFLKRTGVGTHEGNPGQRYLWTDAFAVQACFALYHLLDDKEYYENALELIEMVHDTLGKYHKDDPRSGWISGLPEEEGKQHPTINGLRIGKELPERTAGEPINQEMEWERDGQYFHYLTRWFTALMQAFRETREKKYAIWAGELIKSGENFIYKVDGAYRMYWKMNSDLTKPLVESMGAHDPMEGLICTITAINALEENNKDLQALKVKMKGICDGMNWFTDDALGLGGLILNTSRSFELSMRGENLPQEIQPEFLYSSSISGLKVYSQHLFDPSRPAVSRLAFRECGLSLGFNVLYELQDKYREFDVNFEDLKNYLSIARVIEEFWIKPSNHLSPTWSDHLDINAVTLASSLLARDYPQAFSGDPV